MRTLLLSALGRVTPVQGLAVATAAALFAPVVGTLYFGQVNLYLLPLLALALRGARPEEQASRPREGCEVRMTDDGWRMADGGWRMADARWRWRMTKWGDGIRRDGRDRPDHEREGSS